MYTFAAQAPQAGSMSTYSLIDKDGIKKLRQFVSVHASSKDLKCGKGVGGNSPESAILKPGFESCYISALFGLVSQPVLPTGPGVFSRQEIQGSAHTFYHGVF